MLVILHIAGVINFNLSTFSKLLTNIVMGAMFIIFLILGAVSAKNCTRYKREAYTIIPIKMATDMNAEKYMSTYAMLSKGLFLFTRIESSILLLPLL